MNWFYPIFCIVSWLYFGHIGVKYTTNSIAIQDLNHSIFVGLSDCGKNHFWNSLRSEWNIFIEKKPIPFWQWIWTNGSNDITSYRIDVHILKQREAIQLSLMSLRLYELRNLAEFVQFPEWMINLDCDSNLWPFELILCYFIIHLKPFDEWDCTILFYHSMETMKSVKTSKFNYM